MAHQQRGQASSSTKMERKIIERNRREQMKNLCFKLNSLLPNFNPKQTLPPRVDQIDEAIIYIKTLESRVEIAKEKKESLLNKGMKKRPHDLAGSSAFDDETQGTSLKPPTIEIHERGSMLEIVLMISGFDNQFIFSEIIRILHEENIEVLSAISSRAGDSMIHVVHAENHLYQLGATKEISERLKRFVDAHCLQDIQGAQGP
ncbi:hypothetical protein HN51_043535 [Arachis hypogaea]|uniref:BHLH domain-containing protein n=1 Tax=Arachis hypogaea TaxID=3818 RepID=A0A444Y653_ARAHY|nr:transcription factor bHLH162-like [Arachis ipaensis]XP_025672789.1 transcription factor bHLH162 [Arachis hypogaea]QHN95591.1 uncharacterized protein DS421_18g611020 [Arachis hypogaea]RYQ97432.1 hypothetical protein Ahy_B08g093478 [Arachis hypogaea]